ncbi:MAG: hypothetical protein FJ218_07425, partial [Ignavibacteria bacterium]|nr:hypothetical protein [Ignavibacteria bacterium]
MKNLISFTIIFLVFIFGCKEDPDINNPRYDPSVKPVARFFADTTFGALPLRVNFTDSSYGEIK